MKLMYLAMLSFVFIVSCALSLNKAKESKYWIIQKSKAESKVFTPIPTLKAGTAFPVISAQGALIQDLNSGVYLYEKGSEKSLYPASTTKIMTAIVALDFYPESYVVEIGKIKIDGQKMGLKEGQKISAYDLIKAMLVFSANDAAEALAAGYPGGRELFVATMNNKAKSIGLTNTKFNNPAGLDSEDNITSAKDLEKLAIVAMKNPIFAGIVKQKEVNVATIDGKDSFKLMSTNKLLGKVEGVLGVKTGWTENARENLVVYVERDGKKILLTLLGSQDRFGETKELIDWVFANYEWKEVTYPVRN